MNMDTFEERMRRSKTNTPTVLQQSSARQAETFQNDSLMPPTRYLNNIYSHFNKFLNQIITYRQRFVESCTLLLMDCVRGTMRTVSGRRLVSVTLIQTNSEPALYVWPAWVEIRDHRKRHSNVRRRPRILNLSFCRLDLPLLPDSQQCLNGRFSLHSGDWSVRCAVSVRV